jgi:hypothetical protein
MELKIVFYDSTAMHIEEIRILEERSNEMQEGASSKCPSFT